MTWTVRFVDKPEAGRTTRLDLETATGVYVRPEGFSLGVGEKEVSLSESMLSDGETVTAWKRSNREIEIPLAIPGGSIALANLLNSISRELDRPTNYLEFKPDDHTGESVFFTLVPGGDFGAVDLDPEDYPDQRGAVVVLTCEPDAIGLPQTGTATVSNNPATGVTNNQVLTLPTIKGDVPAPLNVEVVGPAGSASLGSTHLLNLHATPTGTGPAAINVGAEMATRLTDVTLQANDTAMSGTGSNYVRATFSDTAEKPLIRSSDLIMNSLWGGYGTYKVLVRVRKSSAAAVFNLRHELITPGGDSILGDPARYGATQFASDINWIDLGPLTVPVGGIPQGISPATIGTFQIRAARISGTGTLDIDVVKYVPTDLVGLPPITTAITWRSLPTLASVILGYDSEHDDVYTRKVSGELGLEQIRRAGSLPRVQPGYPNHLVLMASVGQVPYGNSGLVRDDSISWSATVTWSYRPRYRYLSAPA